MRDVLGLGLRGRHQRWGQMGCKVGKHLLGRGNCQWQVQKGWGWVGSWVGSCVCTGRVGRLGLTCARLRGDAGRTVGKEAHRLQQKSTHTGQQRVTA